MSLGNEGVTDKSPCGFHDRDGWLYCDDLPVSQLHQQLQSSAIWPPSPAFVYSRRRIEQNVHAYRDALRLLPVPSVLHFSVKANHNLQVKMVHKGDASDGSFYMILPENHLPYQPVPLHCYLLQMAFTCTPDVRNKYLAHIEHQSSMGSNTLISFMTAFIGVLYMGHKGWRVQHQINTGQYHHHCYNHNLISFRRFIVKEFNAYFKKL